MSTNTYWEAYQLLYDHFGPQNWWPGDTPFEIMVGAVLTQNTSWSNVEKAILKLKDADLLDYHSLSLLRAEEISQFIRSSGYYNLKAKRLKNLLDMIARIYGGDLEMFLGDSMENARGNLLGVKGIGPETADSILLYACKHPAFVVDMFTHRVFSRHDMVDIETDYHTMQNTFIDHLPSDLQLYNEFHALIVRVAASYCKKTNPRCDECPLQELNM